VEVSVTRQGKRTVIHLVHAAQARRVNATVDERDNVHREPILDGVTTLTGVELRLPAAAVRGRRLRLVPEGGPVRPRIADGVAAVTLPPFRISTVLVIE